MNKQYDCNIILDLLPLSIENMVTEETQKVIDQHLLTCESCRQIYEDMTRELDITIRICFHTNTMPFSKLSYAKFSIYRFYILTFCSF